MPVYNVEKYLKQAIESALNQTLYDIELICIDDCSTDNSREIIENYAKSDTRIKFINSDKNSGPGFARNIGIKYSQGDYIMFLDPDDWLEKDACEKAYNEILNQNNDIVAFNHYDYIEKTKKIIKVITKKADDNYFDCGIAWNRIYKTSFIKENNIKFGEEKHGEDMQFFFKAILLTENISHLDEHLYYYRTRECSDVSLTKDYKNCFDAIASKYNCYKIANEFIKNNKYNYAIAYCIKSINYSFHYFNKIITNKAIKKEFYNKTKDLLEKIFSEIEFTDYINKQIPKQDCNKIIKYNYEQYQIIDTLERLFSIYIQANKVHINILGIKTGIKLRSK